ncbi:MAG: MMPL family transporter, partial [Gammaproteobacteria bacterium]
APTIDPYIEQHRLHFLSKDQLAKWQRGADYTYGAVLRLADETSLENFAFTLTDFVSANPGQPLPVALDTLLDVLEGTPDASFSTFYPLVDPSQAEYLEFIVVQGTQNLDQPLPNAQIVAQLEAVSSLVTRAFNVDVALTGEVALANEEIGAALTGIEIAGALSVVIIALILGVGLRSYRVIGIIFAKLLLGSCLTLGAATILVGSFNTLSMLFVVMFFGLGIDFSLHFILRAMAEGSVGEQGLKSTFKDTAPALGLCTLTSAIAFLAFVPTDYLGLGELGLISAAGMLIALFLTLLFVPAAYLKWHTHSASTRTSLSVTRRVRLTPRGARLLGCLFLVGSPLALAIALDTQFNYNVLSMRDPDSSAMRALVDLQESGYETDYSIQLTASDEQSARALKARLETLPSVKAVNLPLDFAPAHDVYRERILEELAHKYKEIEPLRPEASHERTPAESHSMISEYIDFARSRLTETEAEPLDRLANALPKYFKDPSLKAKTEQAWQAAFTQSQAELSQMLTAPPPTLASLPDRFRSRLITVAGEHLITVQPTHALTSRDQTDQFVADVLSVDPMAAGRTMVEWGIGEVVIAAFFQAILTTLLAVIVLLILYF